MLVECIFCWKGQKKPINTRAHICQINGSKINPAVLINGQGRPLWGRAVNADLRWGHYGDGWFQAEETAGAKAQRWEVSR